MTHLDTGRGLSQVPQIERHFTTAELAEFIHVKPSTIEIGRVTGNPNYPPFIKIGRRVLYAESDVRAWLASFRKFHSTSEADAAGMMAERNGGSGTSPPAHGRA